MFDNLYLLENGENAFSELKKMIYEAKNSIFINMFIWRADKIGIEIAEALLSAADRGVKIEINIDRYGIILEKMEEIGESFFHNNPTFLENIQIKTMLLFYPKLSSKTNSKLEYKEIRDRMFHHENIKVFNLITKKDHSKYYIFDDEVLILGGINIEDKEKTSDISGRIYQDYMVKLVGNNFVQSLKNKYYTFKNDNEYYFGINYRNKQDKYYEMQDLYLNLINNSQKYLTIIMPYFSYMPKICQAIISASNRGVKIKIIIPGHANFQNDNNHATVKKLMKKTKNNIEVYFSPKMVHTKLMMNEHEISIGSTNINKKSFYSLQELNLFVKQGDSLFHNNLLDSINRTITESLLVTNYKTIKYNVLMGKIEKLTA